MQYARISTILVVLTVVLAGCSGGGVTDGSGNSAPETATPTETAAGTGGSVTGAETLSVADADARLREAGSFTTEWSYTVTEADGSVVSITDRYAVDLNANRSIQRFSTQGPDARVDFEIFVADGTSYTRYGDGEQTFYQVSEQPPNVFDSATGRASSFYGDAEEDAQFVGTETYDGVTVSRYEYSDADAWSTYNQETTSSLFETDEAVTVTDFTVAVLVDSNNVGRLTTWTLTGETESGQTVSVDWRYSLTDIGSTTVEEPDWLADAKAQQS